MTAAEARKKIKSFQLNISSFYLYVDSKTFKKYQRNWPSLTSVLPGNVESIGGSSDDSKKNCLIITGHSKNLTKKDAEAVVKLINKTP